MTTLVNFVASFWNPAKLLTKFSAMNLHPLYRVTPQPILDCHFGFHNIFSPCSYYEGLHLFIARLFLDVYIAMIQLKALKFLIRLLTREFITSRS